MEQLPGGVREVFLEEVALKSELGKLLHKIQGYALRAGMGSH